MSGSPPANDPLIGRQVGDYRILSRLGEGGMGMVYKGQHAALGQIVAVKSLHSTLMNNQAAKDRFIREAQALARVTHPNIISLMNFINNETGCFIIMEFAEGEDLEKKLQKMGLIPPEQCIPWMMQACKALAFAAKQGIVHRDIKPSNIIVHPSGTVKLLDFGTAKLVDAKRLTQQGMTLGTIIYMSKEQLLGKPLDARSDLYSLGVTLYECLTGQLPFYDEEERKLVVKIAKTEPIPPSQHYPGISKELEAVVLKAMAKEPEQRFQTAEEFEAALGRLIPGGAALGQSSQGHAMPAPPAPMPMAPQPMPMPMAPQAPQAPVAPPPAAVAATQVGAPAGPFLLSPLVLVGLVLGILGLGIGGTLVAVGGTQTLKIIGLVVLLVLGLIGLLLVVVGYVKWSGSARAGGAPAAPAGGGGKCPSCGRALLAGMASCPFCNPGAPPPGPAMTGPAPVPAPMPQAVPQPMAYAPGGTLNVNSANAAQNYGGGAAPMATPAPPAMPRPPAGTAVVQIVDGADKGRQYQVQVNRPLTIGRAPTCGATLNDPGVSGTHAQIMFEGPQLVVMDMGSRNGVFVNNGKIPQKLALKAGDLVVIGSTRMLINV